MPKKKTRTKRSSSGRSSSRPQSRQRSPARRRQGKRPAADGAKNPPRHRVTPVYYFDRDAADRACDFFPRFLIHTKGEWAGQPFELADWQKNEIIRPAFGWKRRSDGLRRYRTVYVEVPRKNGKSQLTAGVGLFLLFCDGEPGAEIYSLARDRFQAAIVFNVAADMCRASPRLMERCEPPYKRSIVVPATRSTYQVLSADVGSKHGLSPHGILFDELHVQETGDLWDTLKTGRGARRQPLTFAITTAGIDKKTLCGEMHDKALAIRDGKARDDTFLPVVYGISEPRKGRKKDDWEDSNVWRRVNPNWGISVKEDNFLEEYNQAKESPAHQNSFRRLRLNEWTHQKERWIDQKKWEACQGLLDWQELREGLCGRPCYAGLDLSTVTDLSALVLVFDSTIRPGAPNYPTEKEADLYAKMAALSAKAKKEKREFTPKEAKQWGRMDAELTSKGLPRIPGWEYGDPLPIYDLLSWFWCPDEGIMDRSRKDRMPYDVWKEEGSLIATEGDAVDHGAIRKTIQDLGQDYLIQEIAVDAWNAHKLITELEEEDGFLVARVSQGFGRMTAPTKELDALYRRRQIRHGNHPVLAWCADNVSLDVDAFDNWKPSKNKSRERIDGIVALIMALSRIIVGETRVEDMRIDSMEI